MKTMMIFERPFTRRFTRMYAAAAAGKRKTVFISDFKYHDDVGLIVRQQKRFKQKGCESELNDLPYDSIIMRCRYLRHLDRILCMKLINSAWLAINDVLDERNVDLYMGMPIDNYYLELINIACERRSIYICNPSNSFMPGLTRIARAGEYVHVRGVDNCEVERQYKILREDNFRPSLLAKSKMKKDLLKLYLKERCKKVFFETMKVLKNDRYSFHYNCIYPMPGAITVRSIDILSVRNKYFCSMAELEKRAAAYSTCVFLPLQFVPENSLDYNIEDARFSQYVELLARIIDNIPKGCLLILKEHPDLFGYRDSQFYQMFMNRDNVALVDVDISVQAIMRLCDYVLVTGGASTGAEAVVKGKTVISLGGAYYGRWGNIHEIRNFEGVGSWSKYLTPVHNSDNELFMFTRRLLANCLPGPYEFTRLQKGRAGIARATIDNLIGFVLEHAKGDIAKY